MGSQMIGNLSYDRVCEMIAENMASMQTIQVLLYHTKSSTRPRLLNQSSAQREGRGEEVVSSHVAWRQRSSVADAHVRVSRPVGASERKIGRGDLEHRPDALETKSFYGLRQHCAVVAKLYHRPSASWRTPPATEP